QVPPPPPAQPRLPTWSGALNAVSPKDGNVTVSALVDEPEPTGDGADGPGSLPWGDWNEFAEWWNTRDWHPPGTDPGFAVRPPFGLQTYAVSVVLHFSGLPDQTLPTASGQFGYAPAPAADPTGAGWWVAGLGRLKVDGGGDWVTVADAPGWARLYKRDPLGGP